MKKLITYLSIAFGLPWGAALALYLAFPQHAIVTSQVYTLFAAACMFTPAIAAIITRVAFKTGRENLMLKPNFKGNIGYYLLAWFLPVVLIVAGAAVYFLVYPENLDLSMSYILGVYREQILASAGTMDVSEMITDESLRSMLLTSLVFSVLIAPAINCIPCFGEEYGWRGFLLPELNKHLSERGCIIVSGAIWGLWHAPMIAMGHNYGTGYQFFPWAGILAMVLFTTSIGSFMTWLTLRVKSVWPAVIVHGAVNGLASVSVYFLAPTAQVSNFVGPLPVGFLGGAGLLIMGIVCFLLCKGGTTCNMEDMSAQEECYAYADPAALVVDTAEDSGILSDEEEYM